MPVIVTNCTARKRDSQDALEMGAGFAGTTLADTVTRWQTAVAERAAMQPALSLYTGRSISEVRRVARHLQAPLFFISAGMGIVSADTAIPNYDLTPAKSSGGLASALATLGVSPAEWWCALSNPTLSQFISDQSDEMVLLALPATYIRMLALDLATLQPKDVDRLRIFTSPAGSLELPQHLRPVVMPYDQRLESINKFSGTQADFPQRALRHFSEVLNGTGLSAEKGRQLVVETLATLSARQLPERRRLDDSEVKALIRKRWSSCQGRTSLLLRALRAEELVASEQRRFAQMCREIRQEDSIATPVGAGI